MGGIQCLYFGNVRQCIQAGWFCIGVLELWCLVCGWFCMPLPWVLELWCLVCDWFCMPLSQILELWCLRSPQIYLLHLCVFKMIRPVLRPIWFVGAAGFEQRQIWSWSALCLSWSYDSLCCCLYFDVVFHFISWQTVFFFPSCFGLLLWEWFLSFCFGLLLWLQSAMAFIDSLH